MTAKRTRARRAARLRPLAPRAVRAAAPAVDERVQHVIVLMLENRSFDHMLGHVFNPADMPESEPAAYVLPVDPDHSHLGSMWELLGGNRPTTMPVPIGAITMGGFEAAFAAKIGNTPGVRPRDVLRGFTRQQIPALATLAEEYAVCERWFCSLPGETWPNRNFAHAATSDGEVDIHVRFYGNRTIFEVLDDAGQDWRIYHEGPAQTWAFPRLWLKPWRDRFGSHRELFEDIQDDALPRYAFVEPDHGLFLRESLGESNSQHPSNNEQSGRDFVAGEALIRKLYTFLRAHQAVWEKTLLVVTYDEHGGFADHVHPPLNEPPAVPPDGKGREKFGFNLLGPRVPAVLVSPWIERGTRDQTIYEHSSIPHTLRQLFAPSAGPLGERDRVANSFHGNINRSAPRTDSPTIPGATPLAAMRMAGVTPVPSHELPPQPLDPLRESLLRMTEMVDEALQSESGQRALSATRVRAVAPPRRPKKFRSEHDRARYVQEVMMRFRATSR